MGDLIIPQYRNLSMEYFISFIIVILLSLLTIPHVKAIGLIVLSMIVYLFLERNI